MNFHTLHFTKHISASCIQKQRCKDQHTILQRCISLKYSPLYFSGSDHLIYICHHKTDSSRRTCHETKCFTQRCAEGFMDSRTCTCGKSKLQVAGFADVDLTCIFVSQFQSQRNGVKSAAVSITQYMTPNIGTSHSNEVIIAISGDASAVKAAVLEGRQTGLELLIGMGTYPEIPGTPYL